MKNFKYLRIFIGVFPIIILLYIIINNQRDHSGIIDPKNLEDSKEWVEQIRFNTNYQIALQASIITALFFIFDKFEKYNKEIISFLSILCLSSGIISILFGMDINFKLLKDLEFETINKNDLIYSNHTDYQFYTFSTSIITFFILSLFYFLSKESDNNQNDTCF